MIATTAHVILGLLGLLLLYVGLFLTETEEGQLQNRLEELWVRVDDLHSRALSRQAAFLQQASGLVADGFTTVFGRKLISVKSAASCLCFSLASKYLSLALFEKDALPLSQRGWLVCAAILLACGFSSRLRYISFAVLAGAGGLKLLVLTGHLKVFQSLPSEVVLGILYYGISILIGIGFIALTHWSMRLASRVSSAPRLMGIILSNIALGGLLVGPLIYVELLSYQMSVFSPRVSANSGSRSHGFLDILLNISVSNMFIALAALVVVLAMVAALLHQLVWPAISRPVYAAHRHGLIAQHKFLTALGISCLLLAWPRNPLVNALAKVAHLAG